jgi:hypothetical protein
MAARENESDRRPSGSVVGSVTLSGSDSLVISPICHRLYIGNAAGSDTVKLRLLDGSTPTLKFAAGNIIIDVQFDMLFSTGTSLTNSNAIGFYYI